MKKCIIRNDVVNQDWHGRCSSSLLARAPDGNVISTLPSNLPPRGPPCLPFLPTSSPTHGMLHKHGHLRKGEKQECRSASDICHTHVQASHKRIAYDFIPQVNDVLSVCKKDCAFCTACMLHWWVCNNTPVSWYCVVAVRLVCLCTYTYVTTNECCTIRHVFVYNAGCVCKHACVTGMGLAQKIPVTTLKCSAHAVKIMQTLVVLTGEPFSSRTFMAVSCCW
jgi:hypothetical protein